MMWKSVTLHLKLQGRADSTPSAGIVARRSWRSIVPLSAAAHRQTRAPGERHTVEEEKNGKTKKKKNLVSVWNSLSLSLTLVFYWSTSAWKGVRYIDRGVATWLQVASTRWIPWEKSSERVTELSAIRSEKAGHPRKQVCNPIRAAFAICSTDEETPKTLMHLLNQCKWWWNTVKWRRHSCTSLLVHSYSTCHFNNPPNHLLSIRHRGSRL